MKIKDLGMKCGECVLIEYCDEPFSDVCICGEERLQETKVEELLGYLTTSEVINRDTEEEKQSVIDDAYRRMIGNQIYKKIV